jgi:hypothetical protein
MANISRFIETRLRLKVNAAKSAVAPPWQRKFLGFSFTGSNTRHAARRIAPQAIERFRKRAVLRFSSGTFGASGSDPRAGIRGSGLSLDCGFDLEKFFDRVNHDRLMAHLARRIADKRLLKLIRAFLRSGGLEYRAITAQ